MLFEISNQIKETNIVILAVVQCNLTNDNKSLSLHDDEELNSNRIARDFS